MNGWEVSTEDALPWHVTLFSHENGDWKFFCGGTLLAEQAVLTAGHCVWKTDPKTIRVILAGFSSNFTLDQQDERTQIRQVVTVQLQQAYQDHEGNYGSDLAIIILDKPAVLSSTVSPVCLEWTVVSDEPQGMEEMGLVAGKITQNSANNPLLLVDIYIFTFFIF